jgi:thiosulfate dehydrogenase [quinone] large subunit
MKISNQYTKWQASLLVVMRILIGWHFLYEGVVKLFNPNWSSIGYLMDSKGIFSGFFISLAENHNAMPIIDFLNIWGLIAIGLGLILGCFTRVATISGIVLLFFYYLSHPPIIGADYVLPNEGSYLYVNKTLIEIAALSVLLVFPTGKIVGIDRLIFNKRKVQ